MVMFTALRVDGLLQSKQSVVNIAVYTALFQFWCMYFDLSSEKYIKQRGGMIVWFCMLAVAR
jgi:hypothetical protein